MRSKTAADVDFGFLNEHIGFLIQLSRRALMHSGRAHKDRSRKSMPTGYYTALVVIGLNPGIAPTLLASALVLDPQATTTILDKLVQSGMVLRHHSQTDRRRVELTLTEEGQKQIEKIRERSDEHQAQIVGGLDDAERQTLASLLIRVRKNLVADL